MAFNFSGTRLAPPTSTPFIFLIDIISSAFAELTEPPYKTDNPFNCSFSNICFITLLIPLLAEDISPNVGVFAGVLPSLIDQIGSYAIITLVGSSMSSKALTIYFFRTLYVLPMSFSFLVSPTQRIGVIPAYKHACNFLFITSLDSSESSLLELCPIMQ